MAKVTYLPEAGTPDVMKTLGHTFDAKAPVDVTDAKVLAKLRGNPFFEVADDEPVVDDGLKAVHRGRGVYSVMQGGVELVQQMSKADADSFNALSDGDKAAFVSPEPAPFVFAPITPAA